MSDLNVFNVYVRTKNKILFGDKLKNFFNIQSITSIMCGILFIYDLAGLLLRTITGFLTIVMIV